MAPPHIIGSTPRAPLPHALAMVGAVYTVPGKAIEVWQPLPKIAKDAPENCGVGPIIESPY